MRRLIEHYLPVGVLSAESVRERAIIPPNNRLHIWWARRPLVASRASILATLLTDKADKEQFLHALGIEKSTLAAGEVETSKHRAAQKLKKAYTHNLDEKDKAFIKENLQTQGIEDISDLTLLDPTAGGGAIPFEAMRLGCNVIANDLNPVASLIERATLEYPKKYGLKVWGEFERLAQEFLKRLTPKIKPLFPDEGEKQESPKAQEAPKIKEAYAYLYARTIQCPYCGGITPLSPVWSLNKEKGIKVKPNTKTLRCDYVIVDKKDEQRPTIARGDALCVFPECGRVIKGDEIKRQAQSGAMGEEMYAVVYRERMETRKKDGSRGKERVKKCYRIATEQDRDFSKVLAALEEKHLEWEVENVLPTEEIPYGNDTRPIQYGMKRWVDMFNPRQRLCHGFAVETFKELWAEAQTQAQQELQQEPPEKQEKTKTKNEVNPVTRAAFIYLSLVIDRTVDYNNRSSRWENGEEGVKNLFDRHDYAFVWSYAEPYALEEMQAAIENIKKHLKGIIKLCGHHTHPEQGNFLEETLPKIKQETKQEAKTTITCLNGDGGSMPSVGTASVDVVVMDPPYFDNVMYAEISDFFYVWLKRTAGLVEPALFLRRLTDKETEAVANTALFSLKDHYEKSEAESEDIPKGKKKKEKSAAFLAKEAYQEHMGRIFRECRRVLKASGVLCLVFAHKATGAWDALIMGLMEAGFVITASWPVAAESAGSLHIHNKAAVKSNIFLICRPKEEKKGKGETHYWEDIEPCVAKEVRARMQEFQEAGLSGLDIYLASFGPALEQFSRYWPLERGTPKTRTAPKKRGRSFQELPPLTPEEEKALYMVTPEDALDAARKEVQKWRLEQIARNKNNHADLDAPTRFFVLAWDTFKGAVFPYDEALCLSRVVGIDLEKDIINHLGVKDKGNIRLYTSQERTEKGLLRLKRGENTEQRQSMIDVLHLVAQTMRQAGLEEVIEILEKWQYKKDPAFIKALDLVLGVLPATNATHTGKSDYDVLENLRQLSYNDYIPPAQQQELNFVSTKEEQETEAMET